MKVVLQGVNLRRLELILALDYHTPGHEHVLVAAQRMRDGLVSPESVYVLILKTSGSTCLGCFPLALFAYALWMQEDPKYISWSSVEEKYVQAFYNAVACRHMRENSESWWEGNEHESIIRQAEAEARKRWQAATMEINHAS